MQSVPAHCEKLTAPLSCRIHLRRRRPPWAWLWGLHRPRQSGPWHWAAQSLASDRATSSGRECQQVQLSSKGRSTWPPVSRNTKLLSLLSEPLQLPPANFNEERPVLGPQHLMLQARSRDLGDDRAYADRPRRGSACNFGS